MLRDAKYSNAIISGIGFVAACILLSSVNSLTGIRAETISFFYKQVALLVGSVTFYGMTLVGHIWGFARLGSDNRNPILRYASLSLMVGICLLIGLLVVDLYTVALRSEIEILDMIIGLNYLLFIIFPSIFFGFALLRMYGKYGVCVIPSAVLVPAALYFIWEPWLAAFIMLGSVYLLYKSARETQL